MHARPSGLGWSQCPFEGSKAFSSSWKNRSPIWIRWRRKSSPPSQVRRSLEKPSLHLYLRPLFPQFILTKNSPQSHPIALVLLLLIAGDWAHCGYRNPAAPPKLYCFLRLRWVSSPLFLFGLGCHHISLGQCLSFFSLSSLCMAEPPPLSATLDVPPPLSC